MFLEHLQCCQDYNSTSGPSGSLPNLLCLFSLRVGVWSLRAGSEPQASPSPQEINILRGELMSFYPGCWEIEMQAATKIFLSPSSTLLFPLVSSTRFRQIWPTRKCRFFPPGFTCGHRKGLGIGALPSEGSKWDSCFYFSDLRITKPGRSKSLTLNQRRGSKTQNWWLESQALLFPSSFPLRSTKDWQEQWKPGSAPLPPQSLLFLSCSQECLLGMLAQLLRVGTAR